MKETVKHMTLVKYETLVLLFWRSSVLPGVAPDRSPSRAAKEKNWF